MRRKGTESHNQTHSPINIKCAIVTIDTGRRMYIYYTSE